MDCKDFDLILDELIDGEISGEEKEKALSHIKDCERCKNEYEKAIELKECFKDLVKKSECSLADSVVAKIREEQHPIKKAPFFIRHMGLAASLVIVGALAIFAGVQRNDSNMNILEQEASVTDAGNSFIADIKNSANITSDIYFSTFDGDRETVEAEEVYDYCSKPSVEAVIGAPTPEEPLSPAPEEAIEEPMSEPTEDAVEKSVIRENQLMKGESFYLDDGSVLAKIYCDSDKVLPLLTEFEIMEYGENYIVVKSEDREKIEEIIENA